MAVSLSKDKQHKLDYTLACKAAWSQSSLPMNTVFGAHCIAETTDATDYNQG